MEKVTIYTDGACSGNPGPGGWAAILISGEQEKEIGGYDHQTTNNRMELTAAIEALRALKHPCEVTIYSDSAYLVQCFKEGWMDKWKSNGWQRATKKGNRVKYEPVLNLELWQELDRLLQIHQVTWAKVKGHAGDHYNERVDELAVEQTQLAKKMARQERA
ncbi:MAG: ribonuclease HI [bacterium]